MLDILFILVFVWLAYDDAKNAYKAALDQRIGAYFFYFFLVLSWLYLAVYTGVNA